MAVSFVAARGSTGGATAGNTRVLTIAGSVVPVGNDLILVASYRGSSATAITATDSRGNTYVLDYDPSDTSPLLMVLRARITTQLEISDTITLTYPASSVGRTAHGIELTGVAATTPVDDTSTGSGTSATPTVSNDTTEADTYLVAAVVFDNTSTTDDTWTEDGSWTTLNTARSPSAGSANAAECNVAHRAAATAGNYPWAGTNSASRAYRILSVAYQSEPGAPPAGTGASLLLLGVG
jgi:hypothetical protein